MNNITLLDKEIKDYNKHRHLIRWLTGKLVAIEKQKREIMFNQMKCINFQKKQQLIDCLVEIIQKETDIKAEAYRTEIIARDQFLARLNELTIYNKKMLDKLQELHNKSIEMDSKSDSYKQKMNVLSNDMLIVNNQLISTENEVNELNKIIPEVNQSIDELHNRIWKPAKNDAIEMLKMQIEIEKKSINPEISEQKIEKINRLLTKIQLRIKSLKDEVGDDPCV